MTYDHWKTTKAADEGMSHEPELIVEPTTDRRYYTAGLAWRAYWSDKPDEISHGVDEQSARDWLGQDYPRAMS